MGTSYARWKPLQTLLQNMKSTSTVSIPATAPSSVANSVLRHQLAGQDFGAPGVYDYIGEICEAQGFANDGMDNWDKEALIRNLANLLTTKSNSFTVWGEAQVIRKNPRNTNYGVFEPGDQVMGEKRFESQVERYVLPGKDGTPGNANVTASGAPTRPRYRLTSGPVSGVFGTFRRWTECVRSPSSRCWAITPE